jgi:hypothetical protein
MTDYDSTADTKKHIDDVQDGLFLFMTGLVDRGLKHDASKLVSPEKEFFDKWTPILKELAYGSDEYKQSLAELKPALDHHYAANSHHPEHWKYGISDMSLYDIVEMFCDWKAAVKRTKDGDIRKSLDYNRIRFTMSDQLYAIFKNTLDEEERHNA